MSDSTTHIDTLRVRAPEEAAQQVQLRLSTKLAGADLRPPGLAPAQVLLVRQLKDPEPGRLGLEHAGPTLDRTWERAVRDALADCLHRAVRPTDGRVPAHADAVLFRDAAEAWACWCRDRVAAGAGSPAWWVLSLPSSAGARSAPADGTGASRSGDGSGAAPAARPTGASPHGLPAVPGVWRAQPRLVPAMAAHLTTWGAAADVLEVMTDTEAEAVLRDVCSAFGIALPEQGRAPTSEQPPPRFRADRDRPPEAPGSASPAGEDVPPPGAEPGSAETRQPDADAPKSDADRDSAPTGESGGPPVPDIEASGDSARSPIPPWQPSVERVGGQQARKALAGMSPAHRQLLGVALALYERPTAVRTSDFQAAWRAWQGAVARSSEAPEEMDRDGGTPAPPAPDSSEAPDERPSADEQPPADERSPAGESPSASGDESSPDAQADDSPRDGVSGREADASAASGAPEDRPRAASEAPPEGPSETGTDPSAAPSPTEPPDEAEQSKPFWDNPYAATDLGGVFYLVNVLDELDLPEAARTPPVGEHVGAWAVLEALARALIGSDDETRRPNDPLWHVLADLDGRPFEAPAGRALDAALSEADAPSAYRVPPAWYDPPPVDPPIAGRWGVADGRLRVWTALGCVADRAASDDPAAQAQAEWDRLPHAGELRPADAPGAMPLAAPPAGCAPLLEHWARRAAPFLRARLAAALGEEEASPEGIADLFTVPGRVYSTDTHVDLVLPLDAARIDVRVAGLDRSPGWWAAGGRVVRFHFVGEDE